MDSCCRHRTAAWHLVVTLLATCLCSSVLSKRDKWQDHCNHLTTAEARSLCLDYAHADSVERKACAALTWKQSDLSSYYCAGINDACLSEEAKVGKGHVCVPLPEGSTCGSRLLWHKAPRCVKGACLDKSGNILQLPDLPKTPVRCAARLGGSATVRVLLPPTKKRSKISATQAKDSITVSIDTKKLKRSIPHGFLGVSLEWQGVEYYKSKGHAWADVFRVLGPEPLLRIGGASQDELKEVPKDAAWAAMAKLHKDIGMKFIIGLPLNGNNMSLIQGMMAKARDFLPKQAIVAFELGNEPNYWQCPGLGGWSPGGTYQPGWHPYAAYFQHMAKRVSGCDKKGSKDNKILMGPGWDNLNTFNPQRMDEVLGSDSDCYLADLSLHYYPYYLKKSFNPNALLSEDLVREASRNATLHVNAAAARGHSLRITEANSMSGAGMTGTSDAYAAALWTADQTFEFAFTGVKSLSIHWGVGGLPDDKSDGGGAVPSYAGIRTYHNADRTTAPEVRAPWYGYLLFQAAVAPTAMEQAKLASTDANGQPGRFAPITAAVATPSCSKGQIKIWPVVHTIAQSGKKELRVVVLNKSDKDDCQVTLQLNNAYGDAKLTRVMPDEKTGPGRMTSKLINFGGATYKDMSGQIDGTVDHDTIQAKRYPIPASKKPGTAFPFMMPRATAAILVTKEARAVMMEMAVAAAETVDSISSLDNEEDSPFDTGSDVNDEEELFQLELEAGSVEQPVPSSLNVHLQEHQRDRSEL